MNSLDYSADLLLALAALANIVTCVAIVWTVLGHRISKWGVRNDIRALVIGWGGEVIDLLADIRHTFRRLDDGALERTSETETAALASRVSALVDKARMLFPNTDTEWYRTDKPGEDRGIRPPILDLLIIQYDLLIGYGSGRVPAEVMAAGVEAVRTHMLRCLKRATVMGIPTNPKAYEEHLRTLQVTGFPSYLKDYVADQRKFEIQFSDEKLPASRPA